MSIRAGSSGQAGEQQRRQLAEQLAARERKLDEQQATIAKLLEQQRTYTAELSRLRTQQSSGDQAGKLAQAQAIEARADLAEMTGVEMVTIDAATTTRDLQRELRWNAAYHRLAQGL